MLYYLFAFAQAVTSSYRDCPVVTFSDPLHPTSPRSELHPVASLWMLLDVGPWAFPSVGKGWSVMSMTQGFALLEPQMASSINWNSSPNHFPATSLPCSPLLTVVLSSV